MQRHGDWFVKIVETFKEEIGQEQTEGIIEAWLLGEDDIAFDALLSYTNISFTLEMQKQLLEYADRLDTFNQEKWDKYQIEFTPEQIQKYGLTKRRTDNVERLKELFSKPNK